MNFDEESWDDFDMGNESHKEQKEREYKEKRDDAFGIGGIDDEWDDDWEDRNDWAI